MHCIVCAGKINKLTPNFVPPRNTVNNKTLEYVRKVLVKTISHY